MHLSHEISWDSVQLLEVSNALVGYSFQLEILVGYGFQLEIGHALCWHCRTDTFTSDLCRKLMKKLSLKFS